VTLVVLAVTAQLSWLFYSSLKRFPADLNRGDSQGLIDERIFVH
jgi:hypothetical protein